jgi:alkylation response protein AidB-like acyl-CoA dehydrogenase
MEFTQTAEDRAFREEVRAWLRDNVPKAKRPPIGPEQAVYMQAWQKRQYEAGWAGIAWPQAYGGRGLSVMQQVVWYEECARAGAPKAGCLLAGLYHAGPTLIISGTEEQKAFHLPKILSGETIWCQGFSEPGAGSDLAGLRTRGEIDGDHLVVNGQKIWTSYAQISDYQELLIRTDPSQPKHRGLTWVICDMRFPGITVRPIESLDGEYHNCEVFYDDVRIPLKNVVGAVNDGWRVAMSTLSFERGTGLVEDAHVLARTLEQLIEVARTTRRADGSALIDKDSIATRLGELRAEIAALCAMTYMGASRAMHIAVPGPEGTFLALRYAELTQAVYRLGMDILGPAGLERPFELEPSDWIHSYLRSFMWTIGGGTSEVRRNLIGERILGLPRDR